MPKNRNYRVEVGSNAEWIFLGILIILTILIYPISQKGLIKTLHYFMADIQSAVTDFQDYSLTNEVIADITAANNLTNKKIHNIYKVIGVTGKNILIIQDKFGLKSIGEYEDNNLRPIKIRIIKGEKVNYIIQKIELTFCQMSKIQDYLNPKYEQRIFGTIEPLNKVNLFEDLEFYSTIKLKNSNLVFNYSVYRDIIKNNLQNIYIKKAVLTIKTILKNNEEYKPQKILNNFNKNEYTNKFDILLTIEDKEEILVKQGDTIIKGQIIAIIKRNEVNLKLKQSELLELESKLHILNKNIEINQKYFKLKSLDYEIKNINDKFNQTNNENINQCNIKENDLKVLELEYIKKKHQYKKIESLDTSNKITILKNEINSLKSQIGIMEPILKNRFDEIREEKQFLNNEIKYANEKRLEDIKSINNKIDKTKLEIRDLESRITIKSPVNGIVADVSFTMSIEYLVRGSITILESRG